MAKKGYAKIAALMAWNPEAAMVRQFSELNLQNILYLQAEIVGLEQDFRKLKAQNDASDDEDRAAFSLDWYALGNTEEGDERYTGCEDLEKLNKQWRLALRVRERLKEYNEAVIQYSQMASLLPPKTQDLNELQEWMRRPLRGNVRLLARDRHVWSDGKDLVALKSPPRMYPFAKWIWYRLPRFLTRLCLGPTGGDETSREFGEAEIKYTGKKFLRAAALVGTIVASMLPVLAIVVLYTVHDTPARLGLIAAFTAVFSTCLWFMTEGNLIEVFTATSTFAAVCVVFIGNDFR